MARLLNYSVKLIENPKAGIVNNTLNPAPLYNAKNPYFLNATYKP